MKRSWVIALVLSGVLWGGVSSCRAQAKATHNMEVVGSLPLSATNGDVWAHGNYAYVGTWSGGCPGTGVKIVDTSDPANPRLVATAAAGANTSAEDMVVRHVETASFRGDLLVVGIQVCDTRLAGEGGFALFDVTNPASPQQLAFFATGTESRGVHELDLLVKGGRAYALLGMISRFKMVEVTDPRNPVAVSDWHLTEDLGEPLTGTAPLNSKFVHSALASPDGTLAFLSYWDAGVIILDISDPANPRYLGRTNYPAGDEGNAHSVSVSADNRILLQADEDCSAGGAAPYNPFGFLRVFDISNPASPRPLSIFHSPHSLPDPQVGPTSQGTFCIHNPFVVGDLGFLSWYTDGIRVVDLPGASPPQEVAWFTSEGQIWGVYVQPERDGLVLASDMPFGLFLLRALRPEAPAGSIVNAASYARNGSEAAPVAAGTIVSLFGTKLGGGTAGATSLPLPLRLAGTSVWISAEGMQAVRAPLFYVSPGQINFQVPEGAPAGTARVVVENAGRRGGEVTLGVQGAAPGIFTLTQDGRGAAAALRASDQSPVNAQRPARAGEFIEIFVTGLGAGQVTVTLGGQNLGVGDVPYAGPAPGFAGLGQINFRVPAGVSGNVELRVTAGGVASNAVTVPVQ